MVKGRNHITQVLADLNFTTARMTLLAVNGADESLLGSLSRALPGILTPAVSHHLPPYFSAVENEHAAKALLEEMLSQSQLTAILTHSGEPAGLIFLHLTAPQGEGNRPQAHLGYLLAETYWGGGIGSECLSAYLEHIRAQEPQLEFIAGVEPDNKASVRLLQKLGFVRGEQEEAGVCFYVL